MKGREAMRRFLPTGQETVDAAEEGVHRRNGVVFETVTPETAPAQLALSEPWPVLSDLGR